MSSRLESIYLRLPVPLQHLGCSAVGWRTERTRYAAGFRRRLADAEARTFLPAEEIRAYADARLRTAITHYTRTVPHYRRLFGELGIAPEEIRTAGDLEALPILTKPEIQERYPEFISEAVPRRVRRPAHTSGTTGSGLRFATTLSAEQEQWAIWWRYRRWHGIEPGAWCGYFGGRSIVAAGQSRPPYWRVNRPGRQVIFSAHHMTKANLDRYVEELRRRRLPWLHGFPSLIALVAASVLERGGDLGYEVRWVSTGAENLLPHQASLIERAFGVRPIQHYGLTEGVANFSECERGVLHVDEDFSAVEFVAAAPGVWRIVGTNVTNPATAFVRYDTQDLATLRSDPCGCGRPGRTVELVDGRVEDYLVRRDGALVGAGATSGHIFKDLVNVREAQIHQRRPGQLTIRIVRGSRYTAADEAAVVNEAKKRIGGEADVRIDYVDALERTATGKLRFVVSEIPEAGADRVGA